MMSTYKITAYTKEQARKLGVDVKPSTRKGKKLDVYKDGEKVATIGDVRYADYPTYMQIKGAAFANERRRLYKARHETDRHVKGTSGYYADKLLW